ncbi:hypothetical protein FRZ61_29760 [Hypericibacter adhaerens]|uniref:HTH luxR-type domain-containing protein n=1 Tax=Hypericibacter adhaerens TaxID=2602016 RepID=A0A5J6N035_9PROT|nr:hypothetical protein FRZ61_29760 [Hypericibacter adhaerens]
MAIALALAEPVLAAPTPVAASEAFFKAVSSFDPSYLQTRIYYRPSGPLTSATHWKAGGFIRRIARRGWEGSSAFNYICFDCNPLLGAIREGRTRYRFTDFASRDDRAYGDYWDAMSEAGMHDALCSTAYGPDRKVASLHLGFPHDSFAPDEVAAIQMAGLMLTERIMEIGEPPAVEGGSLLTPRERDCLAYVAEGKSDWEIAKILGISQVTAKFHVDNARRKLGAVNRAHAVARFVSWGMMDPGLAAERSRRTHPRTRS